MAHVSKQAKRKFGALKKMAGKQKAVQPGPSMPPLGGMGSDPEMPVGMLGMDGGPADNEGSMDRAKAHLDMGSSHLRQGYPQEAHDHLKKAHAHLMAVHARMCGHGKK